MSPSLDSLKMAKKFFLMLCWILLQCIFDLVQIMHTLWMGHTKFKSKPLSLLLSFIAVSRKSILVFNNTFLSLLYLMATFFRYVLLHVYPYRTNWKIWPTWNRVGQFVLLLWALYHIYHCFVCLFVLFIMSFYGSRRWTHNQVAMKSPKSFPTFIDDKSHVSMQPYEVSCLTPKAGLLHLYLFNFIVSNLAYSFGLLRFYLGLNSSTIILCLLASFKKLIINPTMSLS